MAKSANLCLLPPDAVCRENHKIGRDDPAVDHHGSAARYFQTWGGAWGACKLSRNTNSATRLGLHPRRLGGDSNESIVEQMMPPSRSLVTAARSGPSVCQEWIWICPDCKCRSSRSSHCLRLMQGLRKSYTDPIVFARQASGLAARSVHQEQQVLSSSPERLNLETGASSRSSASAVTHTYESCKGTYHLLEAFNDGRCLSKDDFLTLFAFVCTNCNWQLALKVFKSMQNQCWFWPNPWWYTKIIAAVARGKRADLAVALFEEVQVSGRPVTVYMCNALLGAYGKSKEINMALALLRRMRTLCGCNPNTSSYNTMISILGKEGRLSDMKELFREMQASRCQPDTLTYNTLIAAYGRLGQYDEMMSVAKTMHTVGKAFDITTYNSLFTWLGKASRLKDLEVMYTKMKKEGLHLLDVRTSNTLLSAFGESGLVDKMDDVFSEMRLSCLPDLSSFLFLIQGYGKAKKLLKMQTAIDEMYQKGFQLDLNSYRCVVDSCSDSGRKAMLGSLRRRLKMPVDSRSLAVSYGRYLQLWVVAYAKAGAIRELQASLKELQQSGFELDQATYKVIIDAYGRSALFVEMEQMLRTLFAVFCNNDGDVGTEKLVLVTAMNIVISAYGKAGRVTDMERSWEHMKQIDAKPNIETFAALLKGYAKAQMYSKMEDVLEFMRQMNIPPDERIYNHLLSAYGKAGNILQMEAVVQEVRAAGVSMTAPATFGCLLSSYAAAGVYEQVPVVLKTMDTCRCAPDARILAMLVSFAAVCKCSEDAQTIIACFGWLGNGRFRALYTLLSVDDAVGSVRGKSGPSETDEAGDKDGQRLLEVESMYSCLEDAFTDRQSIMGIFHAVLEFVWERSCRTLAVDVVAVGIRRGLVSEYTYCASNKAWVLDLRRASITSGEALLMAWLADLRNQTAGGELVMPPMAEVIVGWGKLSKNSGYSRLKEFMGSVLDDMGSPFQLSSSNGGIFEARSTLVRDWLADVRVSSMMKMIWNGKKDLFANK